MPTIPTGKMELELRRLYVRWLSRLGDETNMDKAVDRFEKQSIDLIEEMGGQTARLGALADFPAPKRLDLSPHIGTIYSDMKQAAIQTGIAVGLNSTDVARHMLRAGMDKSYNRLNRLARTETVSAYWKNAWDSIEDLPELVMVWGAESGPRTCQWCLERDGMVMESSQLRDHPNGRCTPIPTLRSMVEYKGSVNAGGRIYQDPAWTKAEDLPTSMLNNEPETPGWQPFMSEADAEQWIQSQGSTLTGEFLHGTSPQAAADIRANGFRTDTKQEFGRMHGDGVYLTQNQRTADMYAQGEVLKLRVAVNNPVDLNDIYIDPDYFSVSDWVEATYPDYTPAQLDRATLNEFVKRKGHDAIIKRGPDGSIDELIIPDPTKVVVI